MSEQKEVAARTLNSAARLKGKEYDINEYSLIAEAGTTLEDVERPEYWAHFATKFRINDEITVKTEDGLFYARLLVLAVRRNELVTHTLLYVPLITKEVEKAMTGSKFQVVFAGRKKFRIVAKSDKRVIEEDISTHVEAVARLAELEKA